MRPNFCESESCTGNAVDLQAVSHCTMCKNFLCLECYEACLDVAIDDKICVDCKPKHERVERVRRIRKLISKIRSLEMEDNEVESAIKDLSERREILSEEINNKRRKLAALEK